MYSISCYAGDFGSCIDRMHSNLIYDKSPRVAEDVWGFDADPPGHAGTSLWVLQIKGITYQQPHNLACLATVCKCICPAWEATVSGKIPGLKIGQGSSEGSSKTTPRELQELAFTSQSRRALKQLGCKVLLGSSPPL